MNCYRVAIWINEAFVPESGGGYSFLSQLIERIDNEDFGSEIEIYFVGFNLSVEFKKKTISFPFKKSFLYQKKVNFYHKFFGSSIPRKDIEQNYTNAKNLLRKNNIDIIFYPTPEVFIKNYPYIIVNWDLGHRTTYAFPEIAMDGQWESRESHILKNLHKALLVCAESESGKNEIIKQYQLPEEKIVILPLFPSKIVNPIVEVQKPLWMNNLKNFFIYPAQFWAHKNHYNLILGFKDFVKENKDYILVLPGSDQGNRQYINSLIKELGLAQQIILPGFISDQELKWLYINSIGLVFPSLLGPTNMPILEAIALKCNVACSNLKGHIAMAGDLAIYFDPLEPLAIKQALDNLKDKAIDAIISKTNHQITPYSIENAIESFKNIMLKSISIRRTWGA
jgi:glycosyltransferase involved in cell wall biosynthesis